MIRKIIILSVKIKIKEKKSKLVVEVFQFLQKYYQMIIKLM